MTRRLLFALAWLLHVGCGSPTEQTTSSPDTAPSADDTQAPSEDTDPPPIEDSAPAEDTAPSVPPGVAGTFTKTLSVSGVARKYVLYVPKSAMDAGTAVPLLVALHGAGDTASNFITAIGMKGTADKHAFVIVAPDAYGKAWFLSADEGWPKGDGSSTSLQNDIALVQQSLDATRAAYAIDGKRLYLAGFSRGAGFTGGLASASNNAKVFAGKYASPFAAYGISAGYDMFQGVAGYDFGSAGPKRAVWIIHGTSDGAVPFAEGKKLADTFQAAGWPTTFTPVTGAPHNWLWHPTYGHSNDELWDFFAKNALP